MVYQLSLVYLAFVSFACRCSFVTHFHELAAASFSRTTCKQNIHVTSGTRFVFYEKERVRVSKTFLCLVSHACVITTDRCWRTGQAEEDAGW
ncbi:Os04g0667300 [Oryza sativa Japonica Group]|uniref:Os04g0667300 protein n=1 Tax=Oryza sativa subsp. japonica TaxID=39947 RepID=Q0J986_ORYSJ|nr:Os04g0667300 [Oryza sativa Japonica Group]|eukprot:NP_001054187.1 Os04g0667300 [Oryza sativa Japonica Group]